MLNVSHGLGPVYHRLSNTEVPIAACDTAVCLCETSLLHMWRSYVA